MRGGDGYLGGIVIAAFLLAGCSSADEPANNGGMSSGGAAAGSSAGGMSGGGAPSGGMPGAGSGGQQMNGGSPGGGAAGAAGVAGGMGGGGSGGIGAGGMSGGAGAGGAAGEAGAAGMAGAGGMAAGLVLPIERQGLHVLEFGDTLFEVDGMTGARVVGYKIGGTNILTGSDNHEMFYGSTLWTGPEGEWAGNPFTPVPGLDNEPYTMTVEQDSVIVGSSAEFAVAAKQLTASKRFSADLTNNAIVIDYSLTNAGDAAFDIGLWEVTRVLGQGVTFYPTGASAESLYGSLAATAMTGHDWIDHAAFTAGMASKVGSDGTGGWLAHVQADAAGDLLFIKQYTDIPDGMAAPGQHEIEVFEQSDASYIELELHSAYGSIPAGMTQSWQVRWYLRRLPAGTDISVGSQALIDAVNTALGL